ncbi:cupredoxin domain-containing protein [Sulfitobacter sp.]|jgi:plastocyanin|uniref:cupredoxin domain-containing protein n=1 Tax=Sulfitobacter sp. TaxID=1903071 RepID=UPI0030025A88
MLSKIFMRAAIAAVALSGTAGSASAEEYHILMMDYAFFPEVSYVEPGDVIIFENISGSTRTVVAEDATWTVADLADGSTASLTILEDMPNAYLSMVPGGSEDEVDADGNVQVVGRMNFSGPPVAVEN